MKLNFVEVAKQLPIMISQRMPKKIRKDGLDSEKRTEEWKSTGQILPVNDLLLLEEDALFYNIEFA